MTVTTSPRHRKGAILPLVAILIVVLIGMVAFAADVGRMYVVRSQLQSAVDSGALAATLQLMEDGQDIDAAVEQAETFVQHNRVGWFAKVPEDAIIVEPGQWDSERQEFNAGHPDANAVRVAARLDDEPLFFAGVFGHTTFGVPRDAIASGGSSPLDIIMVLDLSGSMRIEGRIQALHYAAPLFVEGIGDRRGDDRIGVMGYGAIVGEYTPGDGGTLYESAPRSLWPTDPNEHPWVAVLEQRLSYEFSRIKRSVLSPSHITAGKYNSLTPIGAAIRDSTHYVTQNVREEAAPILVLMSDGRANIPSDRSSPNGREYAMQMAGYAAQQKVKVYTISLGESADTALMDAIARVTGAQHFPATGQGRALRTELANAFRSIAGALQSAQLVQ